MGVICACPGILRDLINYYILPIVNGGEKVAYFIVFYPTLFKLHTNKFFKAKITLIVSGKNLCKYFMHVGAFWWLTTCLKGIGKLFDK